MTTIDPVILQLRADNEAYLRDVRQSTAVVEQQLARQEVAVRRHTSTFQQSAAQARQSSLNLGRQIADVGAQLSGGQSFFLILAQQAPQFADAMNGAQGAAGRLATFFSGPWGAALLAAASVVGVLTGKLLEAKSAGEAAAEGYDTAAAAAGRLKTITDSIRAGSVDRQAVGEAQLTIAGLQAERERITRFLTGGPGEAEARGRLAVIDSQIEQAQIIIRAADIARRNQEILGRDAPDKPKKAKVDRSLEREQRALETSLRSITTALDPARAAAVAFRDTIAEIDRLEGKGLITSANAATLRFTAARQQAEAVARAATERLGELDRESGFDPEAIIKRASTRLEAERETNRAIAEDEAQLRETNVRNLANLYESLLLGGTRNVWDTFKRIGIRVIAETLANFTLGGGGGGGIGAAFTAALGAVFGRNSGGYVAPRQTVRVNEQRGGAEFLRMGAQGGTVIPLGQINQAAARPMASGGVATVRLELSGDIDARIQSVSAGVAVEVVRATAPSMIDASARGTTARLSRRRI
jgi:hypothetical protein